MRGEFIRGPGRGEFSGVEVHADSECGEDFGLGLGLGLGLSWWEWGRGGRRRRRRGRGSGRREGG